MKKQELKVALYCRVGNVDQLVVESQKDKLGMCAKEYGFNNLAYYLDQGFNGLDYDRSSLLQLEADIQAGLVDAVITQNMSRIGRNLFETGAWIERVRSKGVPFMEADLPYGENLTRNLGCFGKLYDKKHGGHKSNMK